jgi:hypothetical protein
MGTRAPINISPLGSAKTYLLSGVCSRSLVVDDGAEPASTVGSGFVPRRLLEHGGGAEPTRCR